MSHFYAKIPVSSRRTVATARGNKSSGLVTQTASWDGAIEVELRHNERLKCDEYVVRCIPWEGVGDSVMIAKGIVGKAPSVVYDRSLGARRV